MPPAVTVPIRVRPLRWGAKLALFLAERDMVWLARRVPIVAVKVGREPWALLDVRNATQVEEH